MSNVDYRGRAGGIGYLKTSRGTSTIGGSDERRRYVAPVINVKISG